MRTSFSSFNHTFCTLCISALFLCKILSNDSTLTILQDSLRNMSPFYKIYSKKYIDNVQQMLNWIPCCVFSPRHTRLSGGDVSRDAAAGRSDEGHQWHGWVWGAVHRDASRHRGGAAHAVQLPVLLVGKGAWEPAGQRGQHLLHHRHLRAPQPHPGQHPQDPQQQPGHRRGLLDEEDCWWAWLAITAHDAEGHCHTLPQWFTVSSRSEPDSGLF